MATITGTIKKADGTAFVGALTFRPLSTPLADAPDLIAPGEITATTNSSGVFSVTLRGGDYRVAVNGAILQIAVPDDSGSYDFLSIITSALSYADSLPPNITLAQWSDNRLKEMAEAGAFQLITPTYDAQSRLTGGSVKWPDGSAGTLTITAWNSDGLPDAYTITHTVSGKTITQTAVTRNATGDITNKPELTIS